MASSKKAPSPELLESLLQSALKHLTRGSRVAVALSGGIDSVVLLDVLLCLRDQFSIDMVAIHVNHGLSPNSDAWQSHCADLCRASNLPFESVSLKLKLPGGGASPEAHARDARYAALADAAIRRQARIVALAHHLDDQSETVLLQLLRGGSPRGLAGMPEWRTEGAVSFWRPLLTTPRRAIVDHALARQLSWVEDESNDDQRFSRNQLRHRVMPAIEEGFNGYRTALSRASRRAQESVELANDLADLDAKSCVSKGELWTPAVRSLSLLRAHNVLRRWLSLNGIPLPASDRTAEFVRQAMQARADRHPVLKLDPARRLVSAGNRICIVPEPLNELFCVRWRNQPEIRLPHGILRFTAVVGSGIDASKVPGAGFEIRPRRGGERLRCFAGRPTRTLKNLLQEAGVAAPLRRDWPLVVDESGVVAVPGVGVGVDWQCPPRSPGWVVAWEVLR